MFGIRLHHVLLVATWIACANLGLACGSGGGGGIGGIGDDDDDGGPAVCCDAACLPTLGSFTFLSNGNKTSVSGNATITDVKTGAVLEEVEMTGWPTLETMADESELAPYEGGTIEIEVAVDAVGFAPFSDTFILDVEHQQVCCSSCTAALGRFDLELGPASNTFLDGCNPDGGDPACPLTLPGTSDSCSASLCCNYDAGDDAVIGCVCNANGTGWLCEQSACACTST